jgi:hypothetical protein
MNPRGGIYTAVEAEYKKSKGQKAESQKGEGNKAARRKA